MSNEKRIAVLLIVLLLSACARTEIPVNAKKCLRAGLVAQVEFYPDGGRIIVCKRIEHPMGELMWPEELP